MPATLDEARKGLSSALAAEVLTCLAMLARNGELSDLQAVLSHTKSENAQIKKAAVNAATAIIHENLIVNFTRLDPAVREKLGIVLSTLSPTVIDEISKDLWGDDDERRLRAVQILGLLKKNPHVQNVLGKLVQDKNDKIRATAVNLLGKFISAEDKGLIMGLLSDRDKRVRANTIEALERLGNRQVVPVLLRYRNDPSNRVRGNVIKALYTLGYADVENDLLAMVTHNDNYMKASAFWVISQIKHPSRAIEDYAGFYLLSENEMVANNARKALSAVNTPRSAGYIRYLDEPKSEIQEPKTDNPPPATKPESGKPQRKSA